ncbi:MAG: hypothetical protein C4345_14985 [Chloroflexota bacterium]
MGPANTPLEATSPAEVRGAPATNGLRALLSRSNPFDTRGWAPDNRWAEAPPGQFRSLVQWMVAVAERILALAILLTVAVLAVSVLLVALFDGRVAQLVQVSRFGLAIVGALLILDAGLHAADVIETPGVGKVEEPVIIAIAGILLVWLNSLATEGITNRPEAALVVPACAGSIALLQWLKDMRRS